MSGNSNIEWTQKTWNPITGCTKVSPGCSHCYAETLDHRFDHDKVGKLPWAFPASRGGRGVTLHPERLGDPLRWRKPSLVFVNSMSDLFHEDVPDEFISWVFAVALMTPQHTYQILTKRPKRMRDYLEEMASDPEAYIFAWAREASSVFLDGEATPEELREIWPLPNVWLGVSVENQLWADRRIPLLGQTPAAIRFISAEPLLGPLNLNLYLRTLCPGWWEDSPGNNRYLSDEWEGPPGRPWFDWCITGGESGPNRRPADPQWFRDIRDQCVAAGVPYFHKQGNAFKPGQDRLLDGRTWDEMPEVSHATN